MVSCEGWADGMDGMGLVKDAGKLAVHEGQMEAKNKAMGVWFS